MKVKKYLCLAAAVTISACAIMFGRIGIDPDIDAITRPSDDSAVILLLGVKSVSVSVLVHSNVRSYYEVLWRKNLSSGISKQLKEAGVDVKYSREDAKILVDIQLATRKETEFVAANISVSFVERMPLERIPPRVVKDYPVGGTTWQSRLTLLLHKNEISKEVPKCLRSMVGHFCRVFHESKHGFPFLPPEKSVE